MTHSNDLLVEIEELKDMASNIQEILPNRFMEQILRVYDIAFGSSTSFNQKVKIPKSLIKTMHNDSISCMKKNPNDKYHKSACECVHWNSHFDQNSMTLHTHTIPDVDYPSKADIKTTNNLNKNNLCIINVSDKTVTCYNKADNFEKIIQQETY